MTISQRPLRLCLLTDEKPERCRLIENDQCHSGRCGSDLMKFDCVAVGVVDRGLAIRSDDPCILKVETFGSQLADDSIHIVHQYRKMLTQVRWYRGFDQVDLRRSQIDPCTPEIEVGSILSNPPSKDIGVELDAPRWIRHVYRDVVHS